MTIGVLSLQGDFAEHIQVLAGLNVTTREVRTIEDLNAVDGLIIPGGESTVIGKFLTTFGLMKTLRARIKDGLPVYGTCAGAILLAAKTHGKNAPETIGAMDMEVDRNAYGPQTESFEQDLKVKGIGHPVSASFIRAPIITRVGKDVEVLALEGKNPVLVRQGKLLAGTFHPEVRGETAIHELFLKMIR